MKKKSLNTSKPIHILVDGPDGCGKSTVCEILSKKLEIPVVRMEKAKESFSSGDIEDRSFLFNTKLAGDHEKSFIVDRGFTSSIVYSKVFARSGNLSYIDDVERILDPVVVILTALDTILFKRRPKDEVIEIDDRIRVRGTYEMTALKRKYPCIDTSDMTPTEVADKILSIVEKKYGTE